MSNYYEQFMCCTEKKPKRAKYKHTTAPPKKIFFENVGKFRKNSQGNLEKFLYEDIQVFIELHMAIDL